MGPAFLSHRNNSPVAELCGVKVLLTERKDPPILGRGCLHDRTLYLCSHSHYTLFWRRPRLTLRRQLMLGNNDVAGRDFVWRQAGFERHLPGRLPDNGDDSASLRSYVVELVPEPHRLITYRIDSISLSSLGDSPSDSRSTGLPVASQEARGR